MTTGGKGNRILMLNDMLQQAIIRKEAALYRMYHVMRRGDPLRHNMRLWCVEWEQAIRNEMVRVRYEETEP